MTIAGHFCPSRGRSRIGDEFDCPECRASLLTAFREPVGDYRPMNAPIRPVPPKLTVDLGLCAYCNHPRHTELHCSVFCGCTLGSPCERWYAIGRMDDPHRVMYAVQDGAWAAQCRCGWRKSGRFYAQGPAEALSVTHSWAERHRHFPEESAG